MEQKLTTYQVTPETAGYLETLRAVESLKNKFLTALSVNYGEQRAEQLYREEAPKFEALTSVVSEYLAKSITENIGNPETPQNII